MFYDKSPRLCVPALARRVLVVEDDASTRRAMLRLLTVCGFHPLAAATFAGACEQLTFQPDAVLTDLMLPDGCGLQFIRRIRQRDDAAAVGVITAKDDDKLLAEVRAAGADAVFRKPINLDALLPWLNAPRPRR
jgi:DNA-binding response OmpR family regulator